MIDRKDLQSSQSVAIIGDVAVVLHSISSKRETKESMTESSSTTAVSYLYLYALYEN